MQTDRRQILTSFASFALFGQLSAVDAEDSSSTPSLARSVVYRFADLKPVEHRGGDVGRQVLAGRLPTGEFVEVHETMLPAGKMSHPPHRHPHTEMLLIRTGELEYTDEGTPMLCGAGDVVFSASMRLHGLRNIGKTSATYFVVAVGVQTPEAT